MAEDSNCQNNNQDDSPDRPEKILGKDEIQIRQYQELRSEVRNYNELLQKQVTRILAFLGLIIAYAGYTDTEVLVSVIPLAVVILSLMIIWASNWVNKLTHHILSIQDEIDVKNFNWEHEYGVGTSRNRTEEVVAGSMVMIMSTTFVVSAWLSLKFTEKDGLFIGFYALLFVILLINAFAFYLEDYDVSHEQE